MQKKTERKMLLGKQIFWKVPDLVGSWVWKSSFSDLKNVCALKMLKLVLTSIMLGPV